MPIVEKIKEATQELNQALEESGAKDKAKSVSLTILDLVGEGITELEKTVNRGFKNLEDKYEENLKKVQAAKVSESGGNESVQELQKLGELHEKGILTDEEFALAKTRLLERL